MKSLRKILAVLVATAMVAGMGVMGTAAVNERNWDRQVSVENLTSGATVTFYQILQFDPMHSGTGGWVKGPDYAGTDMTDDYIKQITGSGTSPIHGITYEVASNIANNLQSGTPVTVTGDGKAILPINSISGTGLYVAIIQPAASETGVVYNPVFVASDWYYSGTESGSNHNSWPVDESGSYADSGTTGVAKKKTLEVKKEITGQENNNDSGTGTNEGSNLEPDAGDPTYHAANKGDVITFKISTTVPNFSKAYEDPTFVVRDDLVGLILQAIQGVYTDEELSGTLPASDPSGTNYNISSGTEYFTIDFTDNYLWKSRPAQPIYIVYTAKIDPSGSFEYNVNEKDNLVTVNYSDNPNSSGSSGTLKDRTKNYVFSIDAQVKGQSGTLKSGTEIVKVAIDADGNEIKSGTGVVKFLNSGTTEVGALQGATFHWESEKYPNISGTVVSDAEGRITIEGIDAGKYFITETSAPTGYVMDQHTYPVEILPTYEKRSGTDPDGTRYIYDHLISYEVKVDGRTTASYTVEDSGTAIKIISGSFVIGHSGAITSGSTSGTEVYGKIKNVQGVALPSTGGIGTTLFYAGGAILVLLAGILLVSKRRIA